MDSLIVIVTLALQPTVSLNDLVDYPVCFNLLSSNLYQWKERSLLKRAGKLWHLTHPADYQSEGRQEEAAWRWRVCR